MMMMMMIVLTITMIDDDRVFLFFLFFFYLFFFLPGPFGDRDDQQVFVQKIVPDTNQLHVRLSSTGKR